MVKHGLASPQQETLLKLLQTHAEIFSPLCQGLPQTRTIQHEIRVTTDQPFRLPSYRYPEQKRAIIEEQIQQMLANGITEQTTSPYSSPIVLAQRKNKWPRFCVDYQWLNAITEDYPQPIPNIPDALKDLGSAKIFSTLDLKSGYWQIPMESSSKKYMAFATLSGGSYQFRVMPFGLEGAPGTFQRLMSQEVLTGYIGKFCIVYLDDIIIYSRNIEDHLHHLALVLERLHIHHLTASLEKYQFGMERLEYLGHIVTTDGKEANPEYVKAIIEAPTPKTKRQLQSFLGTCNWLREYIPHYSVITAPLTELTVKKSGFRWNTEAQKAFESLK